MKILVIGEYFEDKFVYGDVMRLNPESPMPLLNNISTVEHEGGAGNVACNIRALRPESSVHLTHQCNSITKTRYCDRKSGYILLRVDENDQCLDRFDRGISLNGFDAIVFSNYNKGFVDTDDMHEISTRAKQLGIPVFADCKFDLGYWSEDIIIKINELEFQKLNSKQCKELIVTTGPSGASWNGLDFPTDPVAIPFVAGAGDSFLAGLVVRYLETKDMQESIKYANKVAHFAVSNRGIVIVPKSKII